MNKINNLTKTYFVAYMICIIECSIGFFLTGNFLFSVSIWLIAGIMLLAPVKEMKEYGW